MAPEPSPSLHERLNPLARRRFLGRTEGVRKHYGGQIVVGRNLLEI